MLTKHQNAIDRASRAAGGVRQIVENFDENILLAKQSSQHTHRSTESDEVIILSALRDTNTCTHSLGRKHKSFPHIDSDNLKSLNEDDFERWLSRHKGNILLGAPLEQDQDDDEPAQADFELEDYDVDN